MCSGEEEGVGYFGSREWWRGEGETGFYCGKLVSSEEVGVEDLRGEDWCGRRGRMFVVRLLK